MRQVTVEALEADPESGETIIVTRDGCPIVEMRPPLDEQNA